MTKHVIRDFVKLFRTEFSDCSLDYAKKGSQVIGVKPDGEEVNPIISDKVRFKK